MYPVALGVDMGFGDSVQGDQRSQGERILYFSVPGHSLLAFEPPAIAKDSADGAEFAWSSGLKLLIVIFFVVFFLLYVLVLVNGERRTPAPQDRQEGQPTSQMAEAEPRPRDQTRADGLAGSIADTGPAAAEPGGEVG